MPKVTVLMPVYNGEKYLKEAVDSILNQTFADFEFLIINDGSKDKTEEILKSYSDERIKLLNNEKNQGIVEALNKGLDLAQGEYIARMDCDDISLPQRLEKQIEFMDSHLEIGICGTSYKVFGAKNTAIKLPSADDEIKVSLLFESPICHPSVVMRKEILTQNSLRYSNNAKHMEDYCLWIDLAIKNIKFENLKDVLLLHRLHENQISGSDLKIRSSGFLDMVSKLTDAAGIDLTQTELELFETFATRQMKVPLYEIKNLNSLLSKIILPNEKTKFFNPKKLKKHVTKLLWRFIFKNLLINFYLLKASFTLGRR